MRVPPLPLLAHLLLGCHGSERWVSTWEQLSWGCPGKARKSGLQWVALSFKAFLLLAADFLSTRLLGSSRRLVDPAGWLGWFPPRSTAYTKCTLTSSGKRKNKSPPEGGCSSARMMYFYNHQVWPVLSSLVLEATLSI